MLTASLQRAFVTLLWLAYYQALTATENVSFNLQKKKQTVQFYGNCYFVLPNRCSAKYEWHFAVTKKWTWLTPICQLTYKIEITREEPNNFNYFIMYSIWLIAKAQPGLQNYPSWLYLVLLLQLPEVWLNCYFQFISCIVDFSHGYFEKSNFVMKKLDDLVINEITHKQSI